EYSEKVYTLYGHQIAVRTVMKDMVNPPAGFENAFKALEDYYYAYLDLTDLVINVKGTYKSFSEEISAADKEWGKKYDTVSLYVK
ncbi:MAG: hypothetical protein J5874_04995, partial [Oscillospiraceae bacterium]|nr:hypothetical protein [Oscillospiraceae bacterium]